MNQSPTKVIFLLALAYALLSSRAVPAQEPPEGLRPVVSLSVNGGRKAVILSGTPVLIKTAFLNSGAAEEEIPPLRLGVDSGVWTNALEVEILGPGGAPSNWKLTPATAVEADLNLTDKFSAVSWWLAPEDSAALEHGTYILQATYDTRSVQRADSWRGLARSVPATVRVEGVPPVLTEAQLEARQLAFAQYWRDPAKSLAALDELLMQYPTNLGGLTLKSAVLTEAERFEAARQTVDAAFDRLYSTTPEPPEPPALLLELANKIEARRDIAIRTAGVNGSTLTLVWDSEPEQNYSIERSLDLRTWERFGAIIKATEASTTFRTNTAGEKSFFRIAR